MVGLRLVVKSSALVFSVVFFVIIILEYRSLSKHTSIYKVQEADAIEPSHRDTEPVALPEVADPIIVWWTPLTGEKGATKLCGQKQCFFTVNRAYRHHPNTRVFLFYGTDLKYGDLPVPRHPSHEWALLHEESPKNLYLLCHQEVLEVFNYSSTFRREAHLPLTLQYLQDVSHLETKAYLVPTGVKSWLVRAGRLGLVNYVQSDCSAPSDRDHFVRMLMEHVQVDSYGECEHNKDLPLHLQDPLKGMGHEDFYKLLAQYKFTVTFENAVCIDYVTEKFWRPFTVGSVPIVFGSPKIKDFLPSPKSAILVSDYANMDELVSHLKFLDQNDEEYEKYLTYKHRGVNNTYLTRLLKQRHWGTNEDYTKPNFIEAFECLLCERIHENIERVRVGKEPIPHRVSLDHYGCPKPKRFSDFPKGNLDLVDDEWWATEWTYASYMAKALRTYLDKGVNFTAKQVQQKAHEIQQNQA